METTEAESDGYEIITDRDARNLKGDMHHGVALTSERSPTGSPDSGVPLNCGETFLANRVRELQKENDELRRVIQENGEVLQMCLSNISIWKEKQVTNQKDLVQKHGKAEKKVRQLQDEKATLKQEYEEQIKRLNAAENTKVNANKYSIQQRDKLECLEKENASLKLMKNAVKTDVGSLHEHVRQILNLSSGDGQKLLALGSAFFQDLVKVCKKVEESVDLVGNQAGNDPPSVQAKEAINHHQQDTISRLQEELQNVKAKCNDLEETLEEEKIKHSKLEKLNKELQEEKQSGSYHYNNPVDVKGLEKEVHLMKMDIDKMDMVRAGCVSHGSEAALESFSLLNQGRQPESVGSTGSFDFEEERRGLKKRIEMLEDQNAMMDKELTISVDHREKALECKEALENQLKTMKETKLSTEEEFQNMTAKYQNLRDEIEEKVVESQREQKMAQKIDQDKLHYEISVLKAQICSFHNELEGKEEESAQFYHQGMEMQERIQRMGSALARKEEDLRLKESALMETKNELKAVYGQNEKLLAKSQQYRGSSGAEVAEYKSKIDSLIAQLLGAEEMVENKEQDYRKLQRDHANLTSELETVPLLKQQIQVFQTDFETESQSRQKREEDCKRLREELAKLRNENEQLVEEANDPTGSRMAEMQRRHGGNMASHVPSNLEEGHSTWSGFYDRFLAPRGAPPGRSNISPQRPLDTDLNRQVSGGRCPRCERMFPDLDALQIHVVECLEAENNLSSAEKICPKCLRSFPDLDTLQIHVMECLDN